MIIAPLVAKSIAMLVADENSNATLGPMAKVSIKLDDWQVDEAARLRALFDAREPKISQMKFGAEFEIGTQGMVWQYLNATRPLNIDAAVKFALGLGVTIDEFSERIAAQIEQAYGLTAAGKRRPASLPVEFGRLSEQQQKAIMAIVESYGVSSDDAIIRKHSLG